MAVTDLFMVHKFLLLVGYSGKLYVCYYMILLFVVVD
jgi:hypothetical protein